MSFLTRKIGSHEFPAVGFGAMGIAGGYGYIPSTEEERLLVRSGC